MIPLPFFHLNLIVLELEELKQVPWFFYQVACLDVERKKREGLLVSSLWNP